MLGYEEQVEELVKHIQEADAILVGAASGMSAAAGHRHFYEHDEVFTKWFGDFEKKYGFQCTFNGYYHPFRNSRQHWAYLARMGECILQAPSGQPYDHLMQLLQGRNYHILTTNQDAIFPRMCSEDKISAIQGDWRLLQCSRRCHDEVYDSTAHYEKMMNSIDDQLEIPEELIPHCPRCGHEMEPWIRGPHFLEGKKYLEEYRKVQRFLQQNQHKKILFLELGVGRMTPMFIQEPFWNLTYQLPKAYYISINPRDAILPKQLKQKGLAIKEDIAQVFADAVTLMEQKNG